MDTAIDYLDFDLVIDRGEGGYRARVVDSPAGQAVAEFKGFSELELERIESFRLRVRGHQAGKRRIDSPEMQVAKKVGGDLFERLFAGEVRACFRSSLDDVRRRPRTGLRVRLRMGSAPELADLPWEYLYDATENQFLTLSINTPLVRYLEIRRPVKALAVSPPLRVLVMISNPNDIDDLDVEQEWNQLRESLVELEERGLVALTRLETATLEELQRVLRLEDFHVFHYIGHAGFDEEMDDGLLVLETESGKSRRVRAERVGDILHDEETLRLAILNACEGARSSRKDPFSGTAQSLIQKGIPAVIAMQFEISDRAAITFSHEFYEALAAGYPVDAALGEARKRISGDNELEWGTPVLLMRSPDGRIFDVKEADETTRVKGKVHTLLREARAAMAAEDWGVAAETAGRILEIDPAQADAIAIARDAGQQHQLASLYAAGRRAQDARSWDEALQHFRQIRDLAGNYREVDGLILAVERELQRESRAAVEDQEREARRRGEEERRQREEEERRRRDDEERRWREDRAKREEAILADAAKRLQKVGGGKPSRARWMAAGVVGTFGILVAVGLLSQFSDTPPSGPQGVTGGDVFQPPVDQGLDGKGAPVQQAPAPASDEPAGKGAPVRATQQSSPPVQQTYQEPVATPPPPDMARIHGADIRAAIERAGAAEMEAFRSLDGTPLYSAYAGGALEILMAHLLDLQMNGIHQASTLLDRTFRSIDVSADGMSAEADLVETWSTEFHQNGTDLCLGKVPRSVVPQTIYLSRAMGAWIVTEVDLPDTEPEIEPCF